MRCTILLAEVVVVVRTVLCAGTECDNCYTGHVTSMYCFLIGYHAGSYQFVRVGCGVGGGVSGL